MTGTTAPEVRAVPGRPGIWRFRCPWCRRSHRHGGLGHRWAHCTKPGGPYEKSGYVLVPSCPDHPHSAVETLDDSRGWRAFTCGAGCWLGAEWVERPA